MGGSVSFTPRLVTVFVEHERLINDAISASCGLSTTDYCILRTLYLEGGSASGIGFAKFLLLKPNSVSTALSRLRKRGFVTRLPDQRDARLTVTQLTKEGDAAVRQATATTYGMLRETFWKDFTDNEVVRAVNVSRTVMQSFGADMDSVPPERTDGHTPLLPEFISGLKHVVQRWSGILTSRFDLSLSEYRILSLAAETPAPIRSSEIARLLFLAPSAVSVLKKDLASRELVALSGEHGRKGSVICTPRGATLSASATLSLSSATSEIYANLDEETSLYLDEWHMRMYRILMFSVKTAR